MRDRAPVFERRDELVRVRAGGRGRVVSAIEAGTPHASPLSPLVANIALHVLDEPW
jgi:retron-type reverse transcriptase